MFYKHQEKQAQPRPDQKDLERHLRNLTESVQALQPLDLDGNSTLQLSGALGDLRAIKKLAKNLYDLVRKEMHARYTSEKKRREQSTIKPPSDTEIVTKK